MVNDHGALETLTAALMALLIALTMTFAAALAITTQYQRGRTAADLSALAAIGSGEPCTVARDVARRNGARVVECRTDSGLIDVTVELPSGIRGLGLPDVLRVAARAGTPDLLEADSVLQ